MSEGAVGPDRGKIEIFAYGGGGPMRLRLRPMRVGDIPEVMKIEVRSFSLPWTEDAFVREIEKIPFSRPLVAEEVEGRNGRAGPAVGGSATGGPAAGGPAIVGYACWWEVKDECHITNVTVSPEARRRGVGKFLMREILKDARRRGAVRATLEARNSNGAAVSLYEGFGFSPVAMRKGYYPDNGEDALVMLMEFSPDGGGV